MAHKAERALIIGSGIAGLLAARALSPHFAEVVLLERDTVPTEPVFRAGVPQSRHIHILLERGRRALESFFPGLCDELTDAGALDLDICRDIKLVAPTGAATRFESGLPFLSVSRIRLEHVIRQRVLARKNVTCREGVQVNDVVSVQGGRGIGGVVVRDGSAIEGDLVVDASGRRSRASEWLEALGYPCVEETVVTSHLGYSTCFYQRNDREPWDWKALMLVWPVPRLNRGAGVFPVEDGRWVVTLSGTNRDYPPTDVAGFKEFAGTLGNEDLEHLLEHCTALSPIRGYRSTDNRFRHYERLGRWPEGFITIGDGVCCFNPYYGQGMTLAALGAQLLDTVVASSTRSQIPELFHTELARVIKPAWWAATTEDFRFPNTEGKRPPGLPLLHAYMDRAFAVSSRDELVRKRMVQVFGMVRPVSDLFGPSMLMRMGASLVADRLPALSRRFGLDRFMSGSPK